MAFRRKIGVNLDLALIWTLTLGSLKLKADKANAIIHLSLLDFFHPAYFIDKQLLALLRWHIKIFPKIKERVHFVIIAMLYPHIQLHS